jgi:hypothetical protein
MLRQGDLDRSVAEVHCFAALCDDDLSFRCAKLLGDLTAVIGAPTTGAPVCVATGPMSEI